MIVETNGRIVGLSEGNPNPVYERMPLENLAGKPPKSIILGIQSSHEDGMEHSGFRLEPSQLDSSFAYLLADAVELTGNADEAHGFSRFRTEGYLLERPVEGISADASTRHDIDFYAGPTRIGGFHFSDPHPDTWWNLVHSRRELIVIVGDVDSFLNADDIAQGLRILEEQHALVGRMRLTVRAWGDYVGTARPGE